MSLRKSTIIGLVLQCSAVIAAICYIAYVSAPADERGNYAQTFIQRRLNFRGVTGDGTIVLTTRPSRDRLFGWKRVACP